MGAACDVPSALVRLHSNNEGIFRLLILSADEFRILPQEWKEGWSDVVELHETKGCTPARLDENRRQVWIGSRCVGIQSDPFADSRNEPTRHYQPVASPRAKQAQVGGHQGEGCHPGTSYALAVDNGL